ncbi:MAG: hypothetical protein ACI4J5_07895 [Oscillospiraceae bacterium]
MKIYRYNITLHTQIGVKKGTLTRYAEYDSGSECGFIEILGCKNTYTARLLPDGKCSMSGTLKTIVSDFDYRGDGYIYPDKLELTLHGEKTSLLMQGVIEEVSCENV